MTRMIDRFFPHPFLTVLIAFVWTVLQPQVSAGMVVFGFILGLIIPLMTTRWWPDRPRGLRMGRMAVYILIVLRDIIVANIEVAWIVLTVPNAQLKPTWITVPLDLRQPEAITVLAGTITLTPGTISSDLSEDGHSLLVHVLHTNDPEADLRRIKQRYESRVKEIFG